MGRKQVYEDAVKINFFTSSASKARLQLLSKRTDQNISALINEGIEKVCQDYEKKGYYSDLIKNEEMERENMIEADGKQHDTKIIAFSNHKGGVAKTTTCTALAVLLGRKNKNILVLDLDTQRNASDQMGYGLTSEAVTIEGYFQTYFKKQKIHDVTQYIQPTRYKNIDAMFCSTRMQMSFEQQLKDVSLDRGDLVGHLMKDIKKLGIYDYVLVDTSPSFSFIVTSAIKSSDWLVLPVESDKYGLEGAMEAIAFVRQREDDELPVAKIAGVLFARVVTNTTMSKEIPAIKQQLEAVGVHTFRTFIPQSTDVPKSRAEGRPVTDKYPASKASKKYEEMLDELIEVIA